MERKINTCERCPNTSDEMPVNSTPITDTLIADKCKAYNGEGYLDYSLTVTVVRNKKGVPADICQACRLEIREKMRDVIKAKSKPKRQSSSK